MSFKNHLTIYQLTANMLKKLLLFSVLLLVVSSCSVNKFVPKDKKRYTGAEIEVSANKKVSKKEQDELEYKLEEALYPKPNRKIFGLKPGLWAYYKMQKGDSGKVVKWIYKKYGEKPVYLSDVDPDETMSIMLNRCKNSGYFDAQANYAISPGNKRASITYNITITPPYLLGSYQYLRDSLPIDRHLTQAVDNTDLTTGERFDLSAFTNERERIDEALKNAGYYHFNPDYLIFTSDTHQYNTRKFDLYLDLKDGIPPKAQKPFSLLNVYVYPNHHERRNSGKKRDTSMVDGYHVIQDSFVFKPALLIDYFTFKPGDLYSNAARLSTTKRLSSLEMYEFVNIQYETVDSLSTNEMGYLNVYVRMSRRKTLALRQEVKAVTKSTNFAGPGLDLSFKNRNFLKGGEVYSFTANASYETQIATGDAQALSSYQIKALNMLTIPRFLAPERLTPKKAFSIPKTKVQLNYTFQNRTQFYRLNSFLAALSYQWNTNRKIFQEFTPLTVNYTLVGRKSDEFDQILNANPFLAQSFQNQFIPGVEYTFQFSELAKQGTKHTFFVNVHADLAGNLIGQVQGLLDGGNEILGLPYAQYSKADVDFRYYVKATRNSKWVNRLFVGVGLPYGNSSSLPYIKQYFAGGPSSVRAFQVRALGPGAYVPPSNNTTNFFEQAGDIRLEANSEYRFPVLSYLKGAIFVDAGNIWLANENTAIPNSRFTHNWYKQIAIGSGIGLRLDIDFLVLRLDAGVPIRYPYEGTDNSHWQSNYFSSWDWTSDNVVLNVAIGYPF